MRLIFSASKEMAVVCMSFQDYYFLWRSSHLSIHGGKTNASTFSAGTCVFPKLACHLVKIARICCKYGTSLHAY